MRRLWIIIPLTYALWYTVPRETQPNGWVRFTDFHIYYHAALGDYEWRAEWADDAKHGAWRGWSYADWTVVFFKPFTFTDIETAGWIFFVIQLSAYTMLLWKLGGTNYGWIVGIFSLKLGAWLLYAGNIGLLLAALSTTFIGSACAAFIKPYIVAVAVLHAYKTELGEWLGTADRV